MRELTKAEEQIMQVLWQRGPSFVKEVIAQLSDQKPAYSTISTIIRILQEKGFVDHKAYGPTHQYFALISKEEYSHFTMKKMLNNYFDGSLKEMVSFFSKKEDLDISEMEDILEVLKKMKG
ncbi:MAG: BlaI/MecI/CopY family transcriptional regulator [Bacteroidetes bacterium]|jgi:BlaI family transcriptional regulator, penicillinase repressor|nr:BlaI/MecI/CopY family transcriptional regulator [Bacteroidota bacterium]MBT7465644.1 BlaI/MecI/CopY family transcriptional regulator [Bacteroidota bacterium]